MVWLVRDCCGIACVILAWLLLALSQYALLVVILFPQPESSSKYIHIIVFECFFTLAIIAHIKSIFTDPGSVTRGTIAPESIQEIHLNPVTNQAIVKCSECFSVKPDRAHHCSICRRCIRKMDHHCPWVNNCVGERNQKFFVLFILYVSILSFHALILAVGHFMRCFEADYSSSSNSCLSIKKNARPSPGNLIALMFLFFESALFSLFTIIMLYIQLKAIWTDWTGIENLKRENRDRRSGCSNLKDVFGGNIMLWLLPFTSAPSKDGNNLITSPDAGRGVGRSYNCPA